MTAIAITLILCTAAVMITAMIFMYFRWFYDTEAERYKKQYR